MFRKITHFFKKSPSKWSNRFKWTCSDSTLSRMQPTNFFCDWENNGRATISKYINACQTLNYGWAWPSESPLSQNGTTSLLSPSGGLWNRIRCTPLYISFIFCGATFRDILAKKHPNGFVTLETTRTRSEKEPRVLGYKHDDARKNTFFPLKWKH